MKGGEYGGGQMKTYHAAYHEKDIRESWAYYAFYAESDNEAIKLARDFALARSHERPDFELADLTEEILQQRSIRMPETSDDNKEYDGWDLAQRLKGADFRGFNVVIEHFDYRALAMRGKLKGGGSEQTKESGNKKNKIKKPKGRYKVIGVDKFDGEDFEAGCYDSAEEALKVAREKTRESIANASDHSVATVYYAYAPDGKYIGGDAWVGE